MKNNRALFLSDNGGDSRFEQPARPVGSIANQTAKDNIGSIGPILAAMGATASFALSLNPANGIQMVTIDFPLTTIYGSVADLAAACDIAVAGEARRAQNQAVMPALGADLTLALTPTNIACFGVKLTVSNPFQTFPYGGRVYVQLQDGANAFYQVGIDVNQLPGSVVLFGVRNAGGKVSVVRIANPTVVVNGSANVTAASATLSSETLIRIESLNARDMGQLTIT